MDKIIKTEYEWGKAARNTNLVLGIIPGLIALWILGAFLVTGTKMPATNFVVFIFFAGGSIIGIASFVSQIKNRIFIKTTNEGINISPIVVDFIFSRQVIKWEDISKIEIKKFGKSEKIVLSLLTGKNINIKLGYLNKDDRESLKQSLLKDQGH